MGFTIVPVERESVVTQVPEDVAQSLEEAYAYQLAHPGHVNLITFEDETVTEPNEKGEQVTRVVKTAAQQLKTFRRQAEHYLATRDGGALVHEKIRTDSLGDDAMRFIILKEEDRQHRGRKPGSNGTAQPAKKAAPRKAAR